MSLYALADTGESELCALRPPKGKGEVPLEPARAFEEGEGLCACKRGSVRLPLRIGRIYIVRNESDMGSSRKIGTERAHEDKHERQHEMEVLSEMHWANEERRRAASVHREDFARAFEKEEKDQGGDSDKKAHHS